jgi:hypothetical protein
MGDTRRPVTPACAVGRKLESTAEERAAFEAKHGPIQRRLLDDYNEATERARRKRPRWLGGEGLGRAPRRMGGVREDRERRAGVALDPPCSCDAWMMVDAHLHRPSCDYRRAHVTPRSARTAPAPRLRLDPEPLPTLPLDAPAPATRTRTASQPPAPPAPAAPPDLGPPSDATRAAAARLAGLFDRHRKP